MIFLIILYLKSHLTISLFHFLYLIKWQFQKDLNFFFFFVLSSFYQSLVCRRLNTRFNLASTCYDVILFVVLLRHFICVRVIQTSKSSGFDQSKISNYDRQNVE